MSEGTTTGDRVGAVHYVLMALVVMNLVFVQLTESASALYLAPLYALTLASPWLARFRERLAYRAGWNVLVLGFFGLLVRHALDRELASVLQDGLVLAVLCQVHLLNNLRAEQRPDLLLLNSYLIAVITGYLTVDLGFAGAFILFAPLFVLGLVMQSIRGERGEVAPGAIGEAVRDGLLRASVVVATALLAFLFWPRDFEREALLAKYVDIDTSAGPSRVGFSEQLDLEAAARGVEAGGVAVMSLELLEGEAGVVPTLWRGATLPETTRRGNWQAVSRPLVRSGPLSDPLWRMDSGWRSMERRGERATTRIRVRRLSSATRRLFLPREATEVGLDAIHRQGRLDADADGTARYSNPGELRYEVGLGVPAPRSARAPRPVELSPFLQVVPSFHTRAALDLGRRVRDQLPAAATDREIVHHMAATVRDRAPYRLPGEQGASASLHEFLTTDKGGHCESFASALATMLRAVEIPARVVTGYRVDPPEAMGDVVQVWSSDAHAWVEAYVDGEGWVTLDPTPAADGARSGAGFFARWSDRLGERAQELWNRVTGFDGDARAAAGEWLAALPGRLMVVLRERPALALPFPACAGLLAWWLVRRARRRTPESVRRLQRAMRAARITRRVGETPRETLERAEAADAAAPEAIEELRSAVRAHEVDRYAPARPASPAVTGAPRQSTVSSRDS